MFEMIDKEGVYFLVSDKIISRHGFSTRLGGFSSLEHTGSLNLAFGRGDDEGTVLKNVCIFACALGISGEDIISVPQIHSREVRTVFLNDRGLGVIKAPSFSCDGYVTNENDVPIGVKTADCVPILLEARNNADEVIAVSAVHAGWRGTADRILEEAIKKLCSFGAKPEDIYAAIGPCIDECCYEVGEDFVKQIRQKLGQNYENKFIKRAENGSFYANLKGMNVNILTDSGVPAENIDVCGYCTFCKEKLFYSHRRQKGIRGAMMSVICK